MRRHDLTKKYLPTYLTYIPTHLPTYLPTYLCTSIREQLIGAIIGTCDIWDTDYNTDNWEPGFMTIFVTWQLIVTLDSIHNSCDVFFKLTNLYLLFLGYISGSKLFPDLYFLFLGYTSWRPWSLHSSCDNPSETITACISLLAQPNSSNPHHFSHNIQNI